MNHKTYNDLIVGEGQVFPLRVVLTVTTGKLLTASKGPRDNGISDLYDILGHMTNDNPFTHQLGRFGEECKPWLLRWYPQLALADAALVDLDRRIKYHGKVIIETWLTELEMDLGSTFDIGRIPWHYHEKKRPGR